MAKARYIFVSGGVISALGKGITASSISMLLKARGYKVAPIKCENNLNVDFGTLNPIEHGDPFLCHDGLEADQDLGNYERMLQEEVGFPNFMTMGQLYSSVIKREREMGYDGEDVEPIPHIVDEIISRIKTTAKKAKADFVVVELGGTVGEYENNNGLYYEAARILGLENPVAHVHVTYVPVPVHIGEPKTKPAQMGIKALMGMGIYPNFIIVRSELPTDNQRKYKFAQKFHIKAEDVFSNENLDDIHEVPLHLHEQDLDARILKYFGLRKKEMDITTWQGFIKKLKAPKKHTAKIAIVGKYFGTGDSQLSDSYHSLLHAVKHAGIRANCEIEIKFVNSDKQEKTIEQELKGMDGIIVPIGWGARGVEGKIRAAGYARKQKIPYLGLCYGMHVACIEYARDVLGYKDANTQECDPRTKHKIIHAIPFDEKYQVIKGDGCSMRLGTYPCELKKGTLAYKIYSKHGAFEDKAKNLVTERHRHRFEFNNEYRNELEEAGLVISGTSPDDFFVEFIELSQKVHPFFLATQGHPEYKSTPLNPHPIFIEFVKAAIENK
ncbi:CTP synthase [Candidatus Dojkabacteria bacterium]|nr:CTP synthase [Candidatus Dojkabacteria bacterium]